MVAAQSFPSLLQEFSIQGLGLPMSSVLCQESGQVMPGGQRAEVVAAELLLAGLQGFSQQGLSLFHFAKLS